MNMDAKDRCYSVAEAQWAERHRGVRVHERHPTAPLGHFSLMRFEQFSEGADGQGGGGGWRAIWVSAQDECCAIKCS